MNDISKKREKYIIALAQRDGSVENPKSKGSF